MNKITVSTSVRYDLLMEEGLLQRSGEIAREVTGTCKACIISDKTVHDLYLEMTAASFASAGFDVRKVVLPPGETSKSLQSLEMLLEYLAQEQFTRSDILVALGGGVIGDLTGFAAAVYLRGIRFIQIPTTLLAAVDASVGGKTAVNLKAGKNLAGAFWQPSVVLYDPATAGSLPESIFLDGLAEVIKSGAIADNDLFTYVARGEEPDFTAFIQHCVDRSIRVKKDLVEKDEHDTGLRQLLNFGHTSAHAIEKCSGFAMPHGFCVAAGMALITKACARKGICSAETCLRLCTALRNHGLPVSTDFSAGELFDAMMSDKKRAGGTVTLILPRAPGRVERRSVSLDEARSFLEDGLSAPESAPQ